MDFESYMSEVERTLSVNYDDTNKALTLGALGLAGETGEVVELVKKIVFHNKPIDIGKLILEMGDVLWYLTAICLVLGVDLDEVSQANVDILRSRHPEGWTTKYNSDKVNDGL
jgi:NTP pyrophosphatase (non-canonical NTP hydrolase)